MAERWRWFQWSEFRCRCEGCAHANHMQRDFVDKLDALRDALGFPLVVNSGYRCPSHNDAVSTTGLTGPHTKGRAVDLSVRGARAYQLIGLAIERGFTGIGVMQHGDHARRFVHLDDLKRPQHPRPTVWTYG